MSFNDVSKTGNLEMSTFQKYLSDYLTGYLYLYRCIDSYVKQYKYLLNEMDILINKRWYHLATTIILYNLFHFIYCVVIYSIQFSTKYII